MRELLVYATKRILNALSAGLQNHFCERLEGWLVHTRLRDSAQCLRVR